MYNIFTSLYKVPNIYCKIVYTLKIITKNEQIIWNVIKILLAGVYNQRHLETNVLDRGQGNGNLWIKASWPRVLNGLGQRLVFVFSSSCNISAYTTVSILLLGRQS